jgi:hypothetical protein
MNVEFQPENPVQEPYAVSLLPQRSCSVIYFTPLYHISPLLSSFFVKMM